MSNVKPTKKDIAFTIYNHLGEVECEFSVYVEIEKVRKVLTHELFSSGTPYSYKNIISKLYIPLLPLYDVDEKWCRNALLMILSPSDEVVKLSIYHKNNLSERWLPCNLQDMLVDNFYKETERSDRISLSLIAAEIYSEDVCSNPIKYHQEFCNVYSTRSVARAAYWMKLGRMTSQEIKELGLKKCDSNYDNAIHANTETFVEMLKEQFNNAFFWYVLTRHKDVIGNFNSENPLKKESLALVRDTFLHSYITKTPHTVFQYVVDTFGNIALQSNIDPDVANSLMFLNKSMLEILQNILYSLLQNALKYKEGGGIKICLTESKDFIKIKINNFFDKEKRLLHCGKGVELVVIETLLKTIHQSASLIPTEISNDEFEIDLTLPKCILMYPKKEIFKCFKNLQDLYSK